jgi:hypothetical protein
MRLKQLVADKTILLVAANPENTIYLPLQEIDKNF